MIHWHASGCHQLFKVSRPGQLLHLFQVALHGCAGAAVTVFANAVTGLWLLISDCLEASNLDSGCSRWSQYLLTRS